MDSKIYIYTKNSSFNLNCNSVGDFPDLELEESKYPITLDKKVLFQKIKLNKYNK